MVFCILHTVAESKYESDNGMKDMRKYSVITGTGSYIPPELIDNKHFLNNDFFNAEGGRIEKTNQAIIEKFREITEIAQRRYVTDDLLMSDIAVFSARDALQSSGADKESLDYIIVAHNFGDVKTGNRRIDVVPSIASRVKCALQIKNPDCVAYDILFGCPGWVQGVIQADYYLKSGDAKNILVIGAETLSRISDPHDMDSMIYADGAGATLLEARDSAEPVGIISHKATTDAVDYAYLLKMGQSYNPEYPGNDLFLKMSGHNLYKYALKYVPGVIKATIDKAGLRLEDIKKVLIHQANQKMDEAIIQRLFSMYAMNRESKEIMPMVISWLGNNSVATIPTLLDLILKKRLNNHEIKSGDNIIFASVGAGMNINAIVYRMP